LHSVTEYERGGIALCTLCGCLVPVVIRYVNRDGMVIKDEWTCDSGHLVHSWSHSIGVPMVVKPKVIKPTQGSLW